MKKYMLALAALGFFVSIPNLYAKDNIPPASEEEKPEVKPVSNRYAFDKDHTQIIFFVDHLGFSKSYGEFHDYDGYFIFDQKNPKNSKIEISIKTDSIDMDSDKWNEHMKSPDFFNVEAFPDMTFKSTDIKITGKKTAKITGDLTLLGVTKPVVLETTYNKSDKHPFSGKYVSGFSAKAKLKRSDFGMVYGLPAVGDEINILIEVEGIRIEPEDLDVEEKATEPSGE